MPEESANPSKSVSSNVHSRCIIDTDERFEIQGEMIVPGAASGHSFVYADILSREREMYPITKSDVDQEMERIRDAFTKVKKHLTELEKSVEQEVGREHSVIFQAHRSILEDPELLPDIEKKMHKLLLNGETVIREVFYDLTERFRSFESAEMRERALDLDDLLKKILRELRGIETHILEAIPRDTVIFARRLLPSDTIHMNRSNACAIVTEKGSASSHAGILAKALGIPYLTRMNVPVEEIPSDRDVIVDGGTGKAVFNPGSHDLARFRDSETGAETVSDSLKERILSVQPVFDGEQVSILANISDREDTEKAVENRCGGIGLFRVENIYLRMSEMPSEEMLLRDMRKVLEPAGEMDSVIRLLDIGGDKIPAYLDFSTERNDQLGLRGVRLLLKYPELLETQLSVCLDLAREFSVKILIPMVTLPEEIREIREAFNRIREKKESGGSPGERIELGAMIETPSAVLNAEEIMKECSFVSIGSNDLIQYTMAADREQYEVADYFEKGKNVVMPMIKSVTEQASALDKECTLCGELAGETDYLAGLLRTGLRRLSVLPARMFPLRRKLYEGVQI